MAAGNDAITVVKVGGSLYRQPSLARVMTRLARLFAERNALVVPGGAVFADQVRSAQKRWGFDDATAHNMALLAMRQYGCLLSAKSNLPTTERLATDTRAIWLPSENRNIWLPDDASDMRMDWQLTSDSIALCIATRVRAQRLVLIKPVSAREVSCARHLVDESFPVLRARFGSRVVIVTPQEWLDLRSANDFADYEATAAFV